MPDNTQHNFDQSSAPWQVASEKLGTLWCGLMHDSPMWPIHGQYECRICGRHYAVPWAESKLLPRALPPAAHVRPVRIPSALLPLAILLAFLLASPAQASDIPVVEFTTGAGLAFSRYTAS